MSGKDGFTWKDYAALQLAWVAIGFAVEWMREHPELGHKPGKYLVAANQIAALAERLAATLPPRDP